jgi:hypothetical protein
MSVQQPRPVHASERSVGAFARFLLAGLLWLVIGVLAGRYFFPEIKIEQVEKRVEIIKRVEVPVDRVVERVVVKEVEKRVEVPVVVERVVDRRVEVPVEVVKYTEKPATMDSPTLKGDTPLDRFQAVAASLKKGMTKDEVGALTGAPSETKEANDALYWFYLGNGGLKGGCIVFRSNGFFAPYRVVEIVR